VARAGLSPRRDVSSAAALGYRQRCAATGSRVSLGRPVCRSRCGIDGLGGLRAAQRTRAAPARHRADQRQLGRAAAGWRLPRHRRDSAELIPDPQEADLLEYIDSPTYRRRPKRMGACRRVAPRRRGMVTKPPSSSIPRPAQRPVEVSPALKATTLVPAFLAGLAVGVWADFRVDRGHVEAGAGRRAPPRGRSRPRALAKSPGPSPRVDPEAVGDRLRLGAPQRTADFVASSPSAGVIIVELIRLTNEPLPTSFEANMSRNSARRRHAARTVRRLAIRRSGR
jgi:hypothetical protein